MDLNLDFLDNQYVAVAVALFVALYGLALGRMKLPDYIKNLFGNNIFRVVFLSLLLVYNFNKAPHIALAIALVFVLTLHYLNKQQTAENFQYLEAFNDRRRLSR